MADNLSPEEIDALQAELGSIRQKLEDTVAINEKLQAQIEELEATVAAGGTVAPEKKAEKPKIPEETFTVDKVKYKFSLPAFQYKGERILASEAITNKDLLKELVDIGFGGIVKA